MVPEQALELLLVERGLVAPEQVMHLRGVREEAARRGVQLPLAAQLIELGCPPGEVPALQAEAAARARGCPRCRRIALGPPGGGPAACPGCGAPLAGLVPPSSQRLPAVGLAQSAAGSSTRIPRMSPPLQGAPPGASGRFPAGSAPGTGSHLVAVPAPTEQAGGLVRPASPHQVPSTAPGEASPGEDPGWGVGRRIGRYEVLEELGRGAMGAVYLVQPLDQPGRELALKLLLGGDMASPARRKRFEDEVRLLMRLDHPNLVKVHDWGLADGLHPFYVMDFVPGRDLREMVKQGPIPVRDATRIVMHLARAVHHAHSQGVIHRDLKPDNVRVAELDLAPTLIDFGLAKDLEGASGLTRTGVALGTPHYMAPEQAEGRHRDVDARTDVWALGVILYELLAGSVPFTAKSLSELARMIAREEPVALRKQRPEVSRPLEDVVRRALKKRPDDRWQSAGAMAEGLAAVLEGRARSKGGVPPSALVAGVILCLGGLLATLVTSGVLGGLLDGRAATPPATPPGPPPPGPGPPPADLGARLAEARASLDRARVADSLVDYRAGLEQVERVLSGLLEQGDRPEARYLRGVVRRDLDRWEEARQDLVEAARGPGQLARALLARGVVELRWAGQRVDAEVAWKQARPEGASPPAAERAAAALAEALRAGLSGDLPAARRGVDAVLAERPEPEVAAEALCALAWTLGQQVARGADAAPALAALLTAERLFRAPRFRYDYALDRALLLCAAGREAEAQRALEELRALSRAGQGALLVEAQLLRKQRRFPEALQALQRILTASGARGVDRAEVEALARMVEAESRGGAPGPPGPQPTTPDPSPSPGQALVVSLTLGPEDPRLNVELNVPPDPGVDGMRIFLRGEEGQDLDLHGRWGERIGSDAELPLAQYHRTSWGPDEDLVLRRGRTGEQELRTGKLQLLVMRLGPAVEAVSATMVVVTLRPGDPVPRLWGDGDVFHQETDAGVAQRITQAQKAWVEGETALALEGLLDLARKEPRHLLYRSSLLAELGRWGEVEAGLAPLKQQAPQDPRLITWLARCARAQGRPAEGAKELAKLVQAQPDLLRPRLELVECLLAAGRSGEALAAAQEVLARDPWESRAAVLAALAQLEASEAEGLARLVGVAGKAETSPPALARAVDELLRRGHAEPARQLLAGAQQRWKGLTPILLAYQVEVLARLGHAGEQARVEALLEQQRLAPGTQVKVQAVRERVAGLKR